MNPTAAGEDPVDRPVRPSAEALTVARILEIRDALLPSQGEPFDCVAFAVEIVKAERARAAGECPALPEPYTTQWINAPFTERLLFTEDQMRQYAAAAAAASDGSADLRAAFPRAWLVEDCSENAARTYIALLDKDDAAQSAPEGTKPIPLYEKSSPLSQDKILDMADGCTLQFHDLLAFARAVEQAHGIGANVGIEPPKVGSNDGLGPL